MTVVRIHHSHARTGPHNRAGHTTMLGYHRGVRKVRRLLCLIGTQQSRNNSAAYGNSGRIANFGAWCAKMLENLQYVDVEEGGRMKRGRD